MSICCDLIVECKYIECKFYLEVSSSFFITYKHPCGEELKVYLHRQYMLYYVKDSTHLHMFGF